MLLRFQLGVEATNQAIRDGRMLDLNKFISEQTQPEAQYFCTDNGKRTGYVFFDLSDSSRIPVIAEPLFSLESSVEFIPVMNAAELQQGLAEARQP